MTGGRGGANKRAVWDLTIWAAGFVYIALVLVVNLDSPLFGLLLIGLATYELLEPHRHKLPPPDATIRNNDANSLPGAAGARVDVLRTEGSGETLSRAG